MRRGFKSQCEQISKRHRAALGVELDEALGYQRFAVHLNIPVWTPDMIPGLEACHVAQLAGAGSREWSAVTVENSSSRVIIVNASHSARRQANDVVHELAHILLDHKKARLEVGEGGHLWLKAYEKEQEDEADWLSAALLLPRDGLLKAYLQDPNLEVLAQRFEVSVELVRMRINRTGIVKHAEFSRRKRGR